MLGEGYWDIIITSLQDICNNNESISFDNVYKEYLDKDKIDMDEEKAQELKQQVIEHKTNIDTSTRLVETCQQNLSTLIANMQKKGVDQEVEHEVEDEHQTQRTKSNSVSGPNKKQKKLGRLYYKSKYNPLEPIVIGSNVAYKLRNRHTEEWIQCEVTRIIGDGIKFEVRDPEPDENNNPGQTFKANYKEIILIQDADAQFPSYPYGFKVLARYPETTTFYPAVVVGTKKDGTVKLKFDGEEETNKETEVERRLVLPFPK